MLKHHGESRKKDTFFGLVMALNRCLVYVTYNNTNNFCCYRQGRGVIVGVAVPRSQAFGMGTYIVH